MIAMDKKKVKRTIKLALLDIFLVAWFAGLIIFIIKVIS